MTMHNTSSSASSRVALVGCCAVFALSAATAYATRFMLRRDGRRRRRSRDRSGAVGIDGPRRPHGCETQPGGYEALIGNTPLVRLDRLSGLVGREIYVKMESLNPGGTGKDRAALSMLRRAEEDGLIPSKTTTTTERRKGRDGKDPERELGVVVEGTSGSTGIALAALCATRNDLDVVVVMPDDQASEKVDLLRCYGAKVRVVPNCAISNPRHYVNVARRIAADLVKEGRRAVFVDQFENEANYRAHYDGTGPEIYQQTNGEIDAFVMSAGTGGTISGVGRYLKYRMGSENVKVVLVDPPGSSLYNRVKHGVAFAVEQRERVMRRHRYDTIAEGIGLDRITRNMALGFDHGAVDDAVRVSDQDAVDMAHWLLREEGLFVGSSSAMNLVGAVEVARAMDEGSMVVTIVCDGGQRHMTRFWNREFILKQGFEWPGDDRERRRLPKCLDGECVIGSGTNGS